MYNCISSVPINRHSEFIKFTYQVISSHSGMTVQSRTIWKLLLTLFVTKRYKTETIWKTHSLAGFHPPFWIRKTSYNEKSQTLQFWKEHPPFISLPLPATLVGKKVSTSCLKMKLLPPQSSNSEFFMGGFSWGKLCPFFRLRYCIVNVTYFGTAASKTKLVIGTFLKPNNKCEQNKATRTTTPPAATTTSTSSIFVPYW